MSPHNLMYSLHTNTHNEYQCLNVAYFFFSFLCCPIMCLYVLSYALWCPLQFPYKNDVQLTVRLCLQSFVGGLMSYLHYLCLFAYSGVQHILCCAFVLFVFVLPNVASFSGLSIFDCPSVFSYVYCSWTINWQLFTLQTFATLEYNLCSGSTSMAISRKKNRTLSTTSNDPTNWGATKDINKIVYKYILT